MYQFWISIITTKTGRIYLYFTVYLAHFCALCLPLLSTHWMKFSSPGQLFQSQFPAHVIYKKGAVAFRFVLQFWVCAIICKEVVETSKQAELTHVPLFFDVSGRHLMLPRLFPAFTKNKVAWAKLVFLFISLKVPCVAAFLMVEKKNRQSEL